MRSATCRARFSAITLLLSRSIQPTIADSEGEWTLAIVAAPFGAVVAATAAKHADALGAQERGEGCGRVGRRGEGARAEVDRVVGVLRLAGRGQPPLVHLE